MATAPGEGGPLFGDPADDLTTASWPHLARLLQPLSWFAFVMGFVLIAIAIVGPVYEPWEAPPQEPLTGYFNGQQWLENWFLAIMYAGTGVGAILLPFALLRNTFSEARGVLRVIGVCWLVTGAIWAGFGTLNYFTHIGLTINTYNASTSQGGNPAASGGTRAEASSALDTSHDTISPRRKACRHRGARTASQGDLGGRVAVPSGNGDGSAGLRSLTQPFTRVECRGRISRRGMRKSSASLRVVVGMGRLLDPMRG